MRIRFGECLLDSETRQLYVRGEPVHVQPRAFQFLELLLENRPTAVSKRQIHERLWPGTFVADATLTSLLVEVRDVIGDEARRPLYVRTVHGFGYAFCGHAAVVDALPAGSPLAQSTFWLVSKTRHVALHPGENIVGRDPASEVWLDADSISRRHARIVVSDDRTTVEDAGSKNGTWLKGHRIETAERLSDGDQIMFGSIVMTFRLWTGGATTKTLA